MIKVLVVDDSSFMRVNIKTLLMTAGDIEVIGIARTGSEAIEKAQALKPDVITMDINMPDMSGIEAVEHIMKTYPVPIIMISSLTFEGAEETIQALEKGAVDYINKSQLSKEALINKIRIAAEASVDLDAGESIEHGQMPSVSRSFEIIGIGISTGGPRALAKFLPELDAGIPASIVIAQHMPPAFTKSLAERLNAECSIKVKEAEHGETLQPGCAYILPGGKHGKVKRNGVLSLYTKADFPKQLYTPSADVLMSSMARVYKNKALCIIMTGMGSDGLEGAREIKKYGGYVIAQSESSSTIFGMPKVIIQNNLQDEIIHLEDLGPRINQLSIGDQR